ncbi:hypothetical protein M011DRAFT_522755 [Sporormia fimetaria CBS 119925]|uniref:Sister chromatid cohesion acetyltransferas-like protein Eco1 n=1 Tax=Sporormia fimetaria CBS 119925 TaxID=1340428 RepID=A0A6A6VMJ7_9PLEO|nr:hypothetical protein M011DRAFT_522755 [Sporormia fimetaria CBS 119925]
MPLAMTSWGVKKPVRTYTRTRKRVFQDEEPPTKRIRVEEEEETVTVGSTDAQSEATHENTDITPINVECEELSSSPNRLAATSSDPLIASTPPSSPPQSSTSPQRVRRPIFSFFKRKRTENALSERSLNVPTPQEPRPKKKRLVQMQLDLASELRKTCTTCGMDYIPSNNEDAAVHRKFHAMNVRGVEFTKVTLEKLRQKEVWSGGDGSFIAVIGRQDTLGLRKRAGEVLKVVETELAAVPIPEDALWSQMRIPETTGDRSTRGRGTNESKLETEEERARPTANQGTDAPLPAVSDCPDPEESAQADGKGERAESSGNCSSTFPQALATAPSSGLTTGPAPESALSCSWADRFKLYVYVRSNKCVGACLAERILEAHAVEAVEEAPQDGPDAAEHQSSSISVSTVTHPAILGISRIWTSSLHRKTGVASRLLNVARLDFLYGMTIEKEQVAFSQPTESGGRLARKWFGRLAGWHVYID